MEAHVPVLWGAYKPIARSENETKLLQAAYGPYSWAGMWQPESPGSPNRGPRVLLAPTDGWTGIREGCSPALAAQTCDCSTAACTVAETHANQAATFIVEQVNLYPGEVTIVGLGPFTNIGLARLLDPNLVTRAHLHLMAGAFASDVSTEHLDQPRHETNLFFDPEMSQAMLRPDDTGANWLSVTVVPVDVCFHAPWTPAFESALEALRNATLAAQYIVDCGTSPGGHGIGLCDELAAVLLTNPELGNTTRLHMDVDISRSGASGDTLSWHAGRPLPPYAVGAVDAVLAFDVQGFYDAFIGVVASAAGPRARPDTRLCVVPTAAAPPPR